MSKTNTTTIAIVFTFAAFIVVVGLAITPALQEANAIDTLSLKTADNKDTTQVALKSKDGIIDKRKIKEHEPTN
jgi:hypothetical protein